MTPPMRLKAVAFVALFAMVSSSSVTFAANCAPLQEAVTKGRQNYIQQDTNFQQETVLQEPGSLLDISCADMLENLLSGVNVVLFDPTTIYPLIKGIIEKLLNQACAKAVSSINSQVSNYTRQISNATQLPYGLGSAVQVTPNTQGTFNTGTRGATSIQTPTLPFP